MKIQVSDYIANLTAYPPGKPVEEVEREYGIKGSIKLASNENPLGPSPKAVEAIKNHVSTLHRYPDGSCYYLKEKLAGRLGIPKNRIILGNGSNEIIELIVRAFLRPGDEAVMAHPAFIVYQMIVQSAGGKNVILPLKNFTHDLEAMDGAVTGKTRLVFITNPNNPTGTIVKRDEFERFLKRAPEDVIVVMDEAYFEYVSDPEYPNGMDYINDRPVISLRTFSKIYGLAGLRIGYGVASEDIINYLEKVRQPFNVNSLAQVAALAALDDHEHVEKSVKINNEGLAYLDGELGKMGLNYVKSHANFLLIDMKMDGVKIYLELMKKGVIVRPMGIYNLNNYMRITVGLPEENRRFIEALKIFYQG
ncbi:MAG: histidinol-phosphate transaminase [Deltaproteobacteria bacterium]|nr:histidinol-phosphate transaminase [Deltaproteobacteria bacterium]